MIPPFCAMLLLVGCIDTGLSPVEPELVVQGSAVPESFEVRDGWVVELRRADLAFGPLYLCAGAQAGDLCEVARGEFLRSITIDALDPEPRSIGTFPALDGPTRSAMWDYGYTWDLTEQMPAPTEAGEELQASVVLEGTARRDDDVVDFLAEVVIAPNREGLVIVRAPNAFEHSIDDNDRLVVSVDPEGWLSGVRFDDLVDAERPDGQPATFSEDGQPWRSVSNALTTREQPSLEWVRGAR
ncbi:MAG: hypothetical protein AAGE52_26425 [Myxococcota bacterium]